MVKKKSEETTPGQDLLDLENTKPVRPQKGKKAEPVQPVTPEEELIPKAESTDFRTKFKRRKWIWLGIAGILVIGMLGSAIGYLGAMKVRRETDLTQRQLQAATQFELALLDIQEGRLDTAQQRLTHILTIYPEYPGIEDKLKEVMLAIAQDQSGNAGGTPMLQETPNPNASIVPTKDTRSLNTLFQQATAQLNAQDWAGLFNTVNSLRDIDPTYEAIKVDGMYYIALRQMGIYEIQSGNLEVGLYNFSLASQIAPLDGGSGMSAEAYSKMAKDYLQAGSYWVVNWPEAISRFEALRSQVPNLMDSSRLTTTQRYAYALEGYGKSLQLMYEYCPAVVYFNRAVGVLSTTQLQEELAEAIKLCEKPPPTPTPTFDPFGPTPEPTKKKKN